MRYAVFGPREYKFALYTNYAHIAGCLGGVNDMDCLISGGGKGVEALAEQYANENKITVTRMPPNYESSSGVFITTTQAFDTRNINMITSADAVIMFWDGQFASMVPIMQRCMLMGKKVILYPMI